MYILLVLGNNYIRGDKMKNRRIKSFFVPVIYGTLVLAFLFSMFFTYFVNLSLQLNYSTSNFVFRLDKVNFW